MKITTYTKKDGATIYRTSLYLGLDQITGKKVKTTVSARTKKELKQKARQKVLDFEKQGCTVYQVVNIKTYQELADLWFESYQHTVKVNTLLTIQSQLKSHLLPMFASYRLDQLTTPVIQTAMNKLANKTNKGEKGAYQAYYRLHSLNKRILQYGVVMQVLESNPAKNVVLPRNKAKDNTQKAKHFNSDQLKTLLTYLDGLDLANYKNLYDVTLYKFLLATGCRISEVLALEWSDIDFDAQTVSITKTLNRQNTINSPKSKTSQRLIDIDPKTVQLLKSYKLHQTQEAWKIGQTEKLVFSVFTRDYPIYQVLAKRFSKRLGSVGLQVNGFHIFRHTHASLLLNAGLPYKELQHRLGHANLSMTMDIYSHLSKENAKKATGLYQQALKGL